MQKFDPKAIMTASSSPGLALKQINFAIAHASSEVGSNQITLEKFAQTQPYAVKSRLDCEEKKSLNFGHF